MTPPYAFAVHCRHNCRSKQGIKCFFVDRKQPQLCERNYTSRQDYAHFHWPCSFVFSWRARAFVYTLLKRIYYFTVWKRIWWSLVTESRPASLDFVITSISLPVFIALPDNAKSCQRLMRIVIPIKMSVSIRMILPTLRFVLPSCSLFWLSVFVRNDVERAAWEMSMTIDGHTESLTTLYHFISLFEI